MPEGEDPGSAADPAGICRQVGAEKSHHLAASLANLAPLTLERGSRVPPCHPAGAERRSSLQGPSPGEGPAHLEQRKLSPTTPLLVPTVGHPGSLPGGEEMRVGNKLL